MTVRWRVRGRGLGRGLLAVRPDGMGDVLLTGPAIRAMAASGRDVTFAAGPAGRAAAALLPGVKRVVEWHVPWIDPQPGPTGQASVRRATRLLRRVLAADAVIFTSFHQSPLPAALVLRMAGVSRISAISDDYPGSLLDVRHRMTADIPEAERNLSLARAAGFGLPPGDSGALAITHDLPECRGLTGPGPYIVVHPGASVPARRPSSGQAAAIIAALAAAGHRVLMTGSAAEGTEADRIAAACGTARPGVLNLAGRTSLPMLAAVLAGAQVVVVPNTGAAHLAAAVGTPVVSLFAPVVPAARWAPYGVPAIVLGDQQAACAGSRARHCPVSGHPCLNGIDPGQVVAAVQVLARTLPGERMTG
jgi:ADP-heptose:LPS heptosyltransferase